MVPQPKSLEEGEREAGDDDGSLVKKTMTPKVQDLNAKN